MRKMIPILIGLTLSSAALAQGFPGGGEGGGGFTGGGGGGGPGGGGHRGGMGGRPGGGPPRMMKPLKRETFDKVVSAMFTAGDTDRDGSITIDELRAIIAARRDVAIKARFEKVDANHNGTIDRDEFFAWQRQMGSAALSDDQSDAEDAPITETIDPVLRGNEDRGMLSRLIEPISPKLIAYANTNYDAGMSLDELLAYEHKRFDAVDTDKNGEISMEEMRAFIRPEGGPEGGERPPRDRRPPAD